jgi:hypothetical protein
MNKTHFFDRLHAWFREYTKHPLESLRQAEVIRPRRLYDHYGYIVKPVPLASEERKALSRWPDMALPSAVLSGMYTVSSISRYYDEHKVSTSVPARCNLCDLYRHSLPCPYFNVLRNGDIACKHFKYVIIKRPNG